MMPCRYARRAILFAITGAVLSACQSTSPTPSDTTNTSNPLPQPDSIPAKGTASTLDLATWNLVWFGHRGNGPTNEALQRLNVRAVIAGTDADIWALQEIVGKADFDTLKSQLPGYGGFIANDSVVADGARFYNDFDNTEQKVGILFKSSFITLVAAKVILTDKDFDFAGRPPMEVRLRVSLNGRTEDIVVIVLHMKCCIDTPSYERRRNAGNALKAYLDTAHAANKVFVIGDWNDDVDISISAGLASPYKTFVDAPTAYGFPTKALSDSGVASTVGFPDLIDHHLVTNEALATYVANSAMVYRVDSFIRNYANTTSDHFPVLTRYTFGM